MNLRELWELCGNRCGNRKNPVISRVERIYKREFPQFPHSIYMYFKICGNCGNLYP